MSKSDEIKGQISEIYGAADWTRIVKRRLDNQFAYREFQESKSGTIIQAYSHLESQRTFLYNGSKIIFGIAQDEDDLKVRFGEPFYQKAQADDSDIDSIFPYIGKAIPSYLRETDDGEWQCDAGLYNRDQLVADLVTAGFTFDLTMSNDLNEDYGGPVYGKPTVAKILAMRTPKTEGDDEDTKKWLKAPRIVFGVWDSGPPPKDEIFGSFGIAVSFAIAEDFERDGYIVDRHLDQLLKRRGFHLPDYLSEDMENTFSVWEDGMALGHSYPLTITKAQVIKDLEAIGFTHSQQLDDFLNDVRSAA